MAPSENLGQFEQLVLTAVLSLGERALHDAALAGRRMSAALSEVWGAKWERRWEKA